MNKTSETGKKGEKIAADFLQNKGYEIHAVNWHSGNKEIDIIAEFNNILVIVEVKSRTVPYIIEPELAVTIGKQKLLIQAANSYVIAENIDKEIRFDIISIVFYKDNYKIEHLEDAFYPKVR